MATATVDFEQPQMLQEALAEASERLAGLDELPHDIRALAEGLCDHLIGLERGEWPEMDPYLLAELMQAAAAIEHALHLEDEQRQCEEVELQLELVRDVLDDLQRGVPVREERPAVEVARWLKATLQASNRELEELLGASARTWERWLSPGQPSVPRGDDEMRIRIAARIANQLRFALTPRGVLSWFTLPHPALDGRPPKDLLADPANAQRLVALAAGMRTSDAA